MGTDKIKMTSIFSREAERFIELLNSGAKITHSQRSVEGRTVLDIFVEKEES